MSGKGIWNPGFWNPEYSSDKESGIPLMIGIQNPSSNDKDWNPVPGIRNPRLGVQNPRLSCISLHGAKRSDWFESKKRLVLVSAVKEYFRSVVILLYIFYLNVVYMYTV